MADGRAARAVATVALHHVQYPLRSLGHGARVGVWFQGCTLGCRGCTSRGTWTATEDHRVDVSWVVELVNGLCGDRPVDGLTVSGGEPFQQTEGLALLIDAFRFWAARRDPAREFDVLAYSGLREGVLRARHSNVLARLDAVVPEPFVEGAPVDDPLRGSANQPVRLLTPLARRRYGHLPLPQTDDRRLDLVVAGRDLEFGGIPGRGLFDRTADLLSERGISIGGGSWRA